MCFGEGAVEIIDVSYIFFVGFPRDIQEAVTVRLEVGRTCR